MLITIYDSVDNPKVDISPNDSSTQVKAVQSDSVLTLSFTHYDHIDLDVDDYADFLGERFWLTEKYRPRQNSKKEWVYDLKLYGVESMIKRLLVIKTVDDEDNPVFTLTAPPRDHVAMIVKCMNDGMGNITDWKVGQVNGTENIVIDYFGKYCDEALKEIAEKVGAEWWVEGQTVNICKCEHGEPVELGYNKGLLSIDPGTANNVKFYTRLYPVGSSRNIDPEKYGFTRLQLPGGQKYVEINADKYGRVDHFEQSAFEDIYPRRVGVVSSVRSEVKTGEDGNPFTIYYFTDNSLPFDPNAYMIGGRVIRVSFQEGSELAGLGEEEDGTYFFEVNFNSTTREFEIITIWPYDNDIQLPGDKLVPKAGDKYILWNLRMPDEYYALAEEEFLAAVNRYNALHSLDISVYKAPTDHVWIEDNDVDLTIGRRVRLLSEEYFPGTGFRESRITRITRKVNLPSSMDIEISDALSRTSQERLSDSIADVKSYAQSIGESVSLPDIIRTGDRTLPTDNNLFSARRVEKGFVSKTRDDRTPFGLTVGGRLTAEGSAGSKDFVDGPAGAGTGWETDREGNIVGESLRLRSFLEVPELRYNRIKVMAGNFWHAPGGGEIESVVPDADGAGSGTAWLKLEDGEAGAVAAGDFCYGVWHFPGGGMNSADDADDGKGNFRFRGFATIYFRITETAPDLSFFRYQLRPGFPLHPQAMMTFVGYGNASKPERQASRYSTRTYERYLTGVTTWEFGLQNVAAQFGDLSNLTIRGRQLDGYSAFIRNIYMSGKIDQSVDEPLRMEIAQTGTITTSAGTVTLAAYLYRGALLLTHPEDTALHGTSSDPLAGVTYTIERNTGNTSADTAWASGKTVSADGTIDIAESDFGGEDSALFLMTAKIPLRDEQTGNVIPSSFDEATAGVVLFTRAGLSGADGATLQSYTVDYAVTQNNSVTERDAATWGQSVPAIPEGHWLWTRKTEVWTDGKRIVSYSVSRNGKDGKSSYLLDLDNEVIAIPLTHDGKTETAVSFSTGARVFEGTADTTSQWAVSVESHTFGAGATVTVSNGTVTASVPAGHTFADSTPSARIKATRGSETLYATWSFYTVKAALGRNAVTYDLLVTPSQISVKKDGTMSPGNTVKVSVLKHDGDETTELGVSSASLAVQVGLTYVFEGVTSTATAVPSDGIVTVPSGATAVQIRLYGPADVTLDRERIPVVRDGSDGENGASYTENLIKGTRTWDGWCHHEYPEVEMLSEEYEGLKVLHISNATGINYHDVQIGNIEFLEPDTIYTMSLWLKGDGTKPLNTYVFPNVNAETLKIEEGAYFSNAYATDTCVFHIPTTEWKRIFVIFRTASNISGTKLAIACRYNSDCGNIYIAGYKLERGWNDHPVWTPNAADLEGEDGNGIASVSVRYHISASDAQPGDSVWNPNGNSLSAETVAGAMTAAGVIDLTGKYLWARKVTTYTKTSNSTVEYTVSRIGADGNSGNGVHLAYAKSNPLDTASRQGWKAMTGTQLASAKTAVGFALTLQTDSEWMGVYTDTAGLTEDSQNPGDYDWVKVKGDKGDKGDNGKDAVTYGLVVSPLIVKAGTTADIKAQVFRQEGTKPAVDITGSLLDEYENFDNAYGLSITCDQYNGCNDFVNGNGVVPDGYPCTVSLRYNGVTIASATVESVYDGTSVKGDAGPAGAVLRFTEWAEGTSYRNDPADPNFAGTVRYIDCVVYTDYSSVPATRTYWHCKSTHTASAGNKPSASSAYWEQMNALDPIYTALIIAPNGRIEFLSSQEIVIGDSNGTVIGRLGTALPDGTVIYMGGSTAGSSTFRLDEAGKASFGTNGGQRIEIDPSDKSVKVYDPDGKKTSEIDGNEVNPDEAFPTSAEETRRTFSSQTITDSYSTVATRVLGTATGAAKSSAGFIRINTGSFTVSLKTSRYSTSSGSMAEQRIICFAQVVLTAVLTVGGNVKRQLLGMMAVSQNEPTACATDSFTVPSSIITAHVPAGTPYSFSIEAEPRFGGETTRSLEGSITISGVTVQPYHCVDNFQSGLHRNGLFVSRNSENYFGALFNEDSTLDFRAVSGGCPVFKRLVFHGVVVTYGGTVNGICFNGVKSAYGGAPVMEGDPEIAGNYVTIKFRLPDSWKSSVLNGTVDEFVLTPAFQDTSRVCRIDPYGVSAGAGTFTVVLPWYGTWVGMCYLDIYKF